MVRSMTGFGVASVEEAGFSVSVEVKSLNSKFLEVNFRLPKNLSDREIELRALLAQSLERGKVNVAIDLQHTGEVRPRVLINRPLVQAYYQDLLATAVLLNFPHHDDLFRLALQMPDAYGGEATGEETRQQASREWEATRTAVERALAACNDFRAQEGKALERTFVANVQHLRALLNQVAQRDPARVAAVRERLRRQLADLLTDDQYDRNRFEQELVYYVEKYDIAEEKARLLNHLDYFEEVLRAPDGNGKKLNFIAQEMGREINTIGSKANDAPLQRCVVEMKEELEKIKEQSLNIL